MKFSSLVLIFVMATVASNVFGVEETNQDVNPVIKYACNHSSESGAKNIALRLVIINPGREIRLEYVKSYVELNDCLLVAKFANQSLDKE